MADDPKVVNDHIDSVTLPTTELVYEGEAKREFVKKMAKLTVRVNPPSQAVFPDFGECNLDNAESHTLLLCRPHTMR